MIDIGGSAGHAINNAAHVAGVFSIANVTHAFLWTPTGGMKDLGTLVLDGDVAGVNGSDRVVGFNRADLFSPAHAFLWSSSVGMKDLGTLPGADYSVASAVNKYGQVVGASAHAFSWTSASGMKDLGTLGGEASAALAINDSGEIVGDSYIKGDVSVHAFLWTAAAGMQDLGTLGGTYSSAHAINSLGQVVGRSTTGGDIELAALFVWSAKSGMQNLSSLIPSNSGWQLEDAVSINRYGQIAVRAVRVAAPTTSRGLLLTPIMHTTLQSSGNPSVKGQTVTFTAVVSSIAGPVPKGESVTFTRNGTTILGTATTSQGKAQLSVSSLPVGTNYIHAIYAGDSVYASRTSGVVKQVVTK